MNQRVRRRVDRAPRRLHLERCAACGQVLAQSNGCPANPYPTAHAWGHETYFADEDLTPLERCPDCWARIGQPHHHDCTRAHCEPCDDGIAYCPRSEEHTSELQSLMRT